MTKSARVYTVKNKWAEIPPLLVLTCTYSHEANIQPIQLSKLSFPNQYQRLWTQITENWQEISDPLLQGNKSRLEMNMKVQFTWPVNKYRATFCVLHWWKFSLPWTIITDTCTYTSQLMKIWYLSHSICWSTKSKTSLCKCTESTPTKRSNAQHLVEYEKQMLFEENKKTGNAMQ